MDLLKPFKDLRSKYQEMKSEEEMLARTQKLREEFELAKYEKEKYDNKFDREEQIYRGDREFGNIMSTGTADDVRTPVRMSFMLIEAQVDLAVPQPVYKAVCKDDEFAVKQIQAESEFTLRSSKMERINSLSEREVKKFGTGIYKVIFNNNYVGAGYRGRTEIKLVNVKNILPNAGATSMEDLEHIYHVENLTLIEAKRRYGKIADKLVSYGWAADTKYSEIGKDYDSNINKTLDTYNSTTEMRSSSSPLARYSVVEKWYRDEDGDIGLEVFSDRLLLLAVPKFYYKRKFDADKGEFMMDKDGKEMLETEDELEEDYVKNNGDVIPKGTKIKRYIPTCFPFALHYNIPRSKCFWGSSDIEATNDIEQSMKKIMSKHEEAMLKSTSKIFYNKQIEDEAALQIDNEEMSIIGVNDINNIRVVDLKDNDMTKMTYYRWLAEICQEQLGITQVWRGMNDNEATSGKMAVALIQQSNNKINIKTNEKYIAYVELYRIVCDFILAFHEGERSYRIDNDLVTMYGKFNKKELLRKDDSGNWIFPEWDIEISAEGEFPNNKQFIYDTIIQLAGGGFLEPSPTNVLVWSLLAKIGFPNAKAILQDIQEKLEQEAPPDTDTGPVPGTEEEPPPEEQSPPPMPEPQEQEQIPVPGTVPGVGMSPTMPSPGNAPPMQMTPNIAALPPELQKVVASLPPELQNMLAGLPPKEIVKILLEGMHGASNRMQGKGPDGGNV